MDNLENNNMWAVLVPIIARYGVEFGYNLWKTIQEKGEPTEEQWQALLTLARKPYDQYIAEARARVATIPMPAAVKSTQIPKLINDGKYNYELVGNAVGSVDGAPAGIPLYERVPADPVATYSPSLEFLKGQTATPIMIAFPR
jgi:hypothetical protein